MFGNIYNYDLLNILELLLTIKFKINKKLLLLKKF